MTTTPPFPPFTLGSFSASLTTSLKALPGAWAFAGHRLRAIMSDVVDQGTARRRREGLIGDI